MKQTMAKNHRYEIMTPYGWEPFEGVLKNHFEKEGVLFSTPSHIRVKATKEHRFYRNGEEVQAGDLVVGDMIDTMNGPEVITSIEEVKLSNSYDIFNSKSHIIYINKYIVSHQCDELSFISQNIADDFYTAIQPTLSTGGSMIVTSTPLSDEDLFAKIWFGAIDTIDEDGNERPDGLGRNGFRAYKAIWSDHPERDEAWADGFRNKMSEAQFKREFECVGGDTLISITNPYGVEKTITIGELYERDRVLGLSGLMVKTPSGYQEFAGITRHTAEALRLEWDGGHLTVTPGHRLYMEDGQEITAEAVMMGDRLMADGQPVEILNAIPMAAIPVYDLLAVDGGNVYYTNGVLSHNCEFIAEDTTLISGVVLAGLRYREEKYRTGNIYWYEDILPNFHYVVALDPAGGAGNGDYAAIEVFRVPDMVQVAEWRSQRAPPREQMEVMMRILTRIHNTMARDPEQIGEPSIAWTFENNAVGQAILTVIRDTEESFPGWMINEPRRKGGGRAKGLNTNKTTKLQACLKLKRLMETERMSVASRELLKEMKSFAGNDSGSFAAKPGNRDDLVMATILCVRIAEILARGDDDLYEYFHEGISIEEDDGMEPMPILL